MSQWLQHGSSKLLHAERTIHCFNLFLGSLLPLFCNHISDLFYGVTQRSAHCSREGNNYNSF
jgi:hypothetical protein